jgi:hypothetical protein
MLLRQLCNLRIDISGPGVTPVSRARQLDEQLLDPLAT